jgi:hypothetical protein
MSNDKVLEEIKKLSESLKSMEIELTLKISGVQKEFRSLVEIQQRLIHERLKVPMPPPPTDYSEAKTVKSISDYKIQISSFGQDRIRISGNTFDYRPLIKSCGPAKWEGELKSWSLPQSSLKTIIEKFKEINLEVDKDIKVDVRNIESIEESDDNVTDGTFGFVDDNN